MGPVYSRTGVGGSARPPPCRGVKARGLPTLVLGFQALPVLSPAARPTGCPQTSAYNWIHMDSLAAVPAEWIADFEAAARRPLPLRMRYAFIHTYKPVLDDARFRAFETMQDYREWCERSLPSWLGYGRL